VGGQKRIGALLGCLFLAVPVWANDWGAFKFPIPTARLELASLPLVPAPLEKSGNPMSFQIDVTSAWAYPTEAEFVAYAVPSSHSLWVAAALEKYRVRLFSPTDFPYILVAKAPLSIP